MQASRKLKLVLPCSACWNYMRGTVAQSFLKLTVQPLLPASSNRSAAFPIIVDVKSALRKFDAWHIRKVSRKCNVLAYELAALAKV